MADSSKQPLDLLPLTPAVFHILLALADSDLHGYGIMKAVEEAAEPSRQMGPGTIYGTIQRMEASGLVEDRGLADDGRRRLYGITSLGTEVLKLESLRLTRLSDMVRDRGLVVREAG